MTTQGVPEPNYTQTPNALFDLMPLMGEAELRVTLAIVRKTFGWHKGRDRLSLSQLEELTGLTRQGVINGIEAGIKRGQIGRVAVDEANPRRGFTYFLIVNEVDQPKTELVNVVDQPSQRSRLAASQRGRHTKESVIKETIQNKTKRGAAAVSTDLSNYEGLETANDRNGNGRRAAPRNKDFSSSKGGTATAGRKEEASHSPPLQQAVNPPPPNSAPPPSPASDGLEEAVEAINRELAARPGATPLSRHDQQALVKVARSQGQDGASLDRLWGEIKQTATTPTGWLVKWVIGRGEWRAPESRPKPAYSPPVASGDKGASKMCRIDTGSLPEAVKTKMWHEAQARRKEAMRRGIGLIESADFGGVP